MIFWIILMVAILIMGIYCAVTHMEVGYLGAALCIELAIIFIAFLINCIGGATITADKVISTDTVELVAFSDPLSPDSTFYISNKTDLGEPFLWYFESTRDKGIQMKKVNLSKSSIVITDDETPHLEIFHKKHHSYIVNMFFSTERDEYVFYIPTNGIRYDFEVKLQ